MGLESIDQVSNTHQIYPIFPSILETKKRVNRALTIDVLDGDLVFMFQGQKVGIIEYDIDIPRKQCYIAFFGTQNGLKEVNEYKKLRLLDPSPDDQDLQGISYAMMQSFIENICYPNHIERIYLDPDTQGKKFFWKDTIGKYFKDIGVFDVNGVRSSGNEVCFTLSSKN